MPNQGSNRHGGGDGGGDSDVVNYAIEFEMFGNEVLREIMSPTFIVLATAITIAFLLIVIIMGKKYNICGGEGKTISISHRLCRCRVKSHVFAFF